MRASVTLFQKNWNLEFAKKKNGICQKKWNLYWILDFWRPPARGRRPLPVNRNYSYYLGPTPHIYFLVSSMKFQKTLLLSRIPPTYWKISIMNDARQIHIENKQGTGGTRNKYYLKSRTISSEL